MANLLTENNLLPGLATRKNLPKSQKNPETRKEFWKLRTLISTQLCRVSQLIFVYLLNHLSKCTFILL